MKNKKNLFLLIFGIVCISIYVYVGVSNFNFRLLSNDSGFDTDYDSSYDSGYDSSYDSSDDYSSSTGSSSSYGCNGVCCGPLEEQILHDCPMAKLAFGVIIICCLLIIVIILFCIKRAISVIRKNSNNESKTAKTEDYSIIATAKEIFYEVQIAWMNYDYNKLKELVTDELYNTYYNQLQSLAMKGQKNIMSDFVFLDGYVLNKYEVSGLETVEISLTVEFIDYIADSNGQVVRGNQYQKVSNTYNLVFVTNKASIDACPNCNAPLSPNDVTCNYCRTKIQGVRGKMKLSQKKKIR